MKLWGEEGRGVGIVKKREAQIGEGPRSEGYIEKGKGNEVVKKERERPRERDEEMKEERKGDKKIERVREREKTHATIFLIASAS